MPVTLPRSVDGPVPSLPGRISVLEERRTEIPEQVEPVTVEIPVIAEPNGSVSFLKVVMMWIKESLITDILNQKKGFNMSNDLKTTVTGVVTGVLAIAAVFGLAVPAEWVTVIVSVGVAILGYFTNKKDKE